MLPTSAYGFTLRRRAVGSICSPPPSSDLSLGHTLNRRSAISRAAARAQPYAHQHRDGDQHRHTRVSPAADGYAHDTSPTTDGYALPRRELQSVGLQLLMLQLHLQPAVQLLRLLQLYRQLLVFHERLCEECQDQTYSHSGGRSGSCSYHGGNWRALLQPRCSTITPAVDAPGGVWRRRYRAQRMFDPGQP